LDISYEERHNLPSAGFGLGLMPHVTDHFFLDFNLGLDFLIMGSKPEFSNKIEYDWNYNGQYHEYATLESQFTGVKPSFFMNIGLGYYF